MGSGRAWQGRGPEINLPGAEPEGGVAGNRVFERAAAGIGGGNPEAVVPVSNIRQANRELADPDSALSRFYRAVESNKEGE